MLEKHLWSVHVIAVRTRACQVAKYTDFLRRGTRRQKVTLTIYSVVDERVSVIINNKALRVWYMHSTSVKCSYTTNDFDIWKVTTVLK